MNLPKKMGLNRVTLSTQINGTANIASYEKIAAALDVPMWQLFASSQEVQETKNTITCPHCGKPIELKVK